MNSLLHFIPIYIICRADYTKIAKDGPETPLHHHSGRQIFEIWEEITPVVEHFLKHHNGKCTEIKV